MRNTRFGLILLGVMLLLVGCTSSRSYFDVHPPHPVTVERAPAPTPGGDPDATDPRTVPLYTGVGVPIEWSDLVEAAMWADVVFMGELHDDAIGHRVQRALVTDVAAQCRGLALSLEMLDRTEQSVVDDYLAGIIDRETFMESVASTRWRRLAREYLDGTIERDEFEEKIFRFGWPDWENNYQPIIDAVRDAGGTVVAANTPWRRYQSLASRKGNAHLATLTRAQQRLFDLPVRSYRDGSYRDRFWGLMGDSSSAHAARLEGAFRAQLLMDATMAASMARAHRAGAPKIIHLVGQFHSDFEGATVTEFRARRPSARVLTVSMQPGWPDALQDDDLGRAHVVLYTGERPDEDEDSDASDDTSS